MLDFLIYLHVVAAVFMGFYLVLPFLSGRLAALTGDKLAGYLQVLFGMNRAGQWMIWIAFLTGGYLISKKPYTVWWMALVIVLFLAIAAVAGIMGKRMRLTLADPSGEKKSQYLGAVRTLSLINGVLYFAIVTVMQFPFYNQ